MVVNAPGRLDAGALRRGINAGGWIAVLAVALVLPLVQPGYVVALATMALANTVAIAGLGVVSGIAGQVSLAQSVFVAAGAYTTAILMQRLGWPLPATFLVSALACFVLGLLVGLPAARLHGHYLAVITFVLALIVPPLIMRFQEVTGGANGLPITVKMVPEFGLEKDQWKFYIALAFAAVVLYLLANLRSSSFGKRLVLMHSRPLVAEAFGVNAALLKALAFAWSGLFGGIAGSLMAMLDAFAAPQSFGFLLSIMLLVGAVIGGIGSASGALIGGIVLVVLPLLTNQAGLGWVGVIYGVLVVAMITAAPKGIAGLLMALRDRLIGWVVARRGNPSSPLVAEVSA